MNKPMIAALVVLALFLAALALSGERRGYQACVAIEGNAWRPCP